MDTSLNLIYRGKTIDTTTTVKIKLSRINTTHQITFGAPPTLVNKHSCVFGNDLFISSGLLAKNENENSVKGSSVIDVYDLRKGQYRFSFYIPDYEGFKLKGFVVSGKKIIGIFDHYLVSYDLNAAYF